MRHSHDGLVGARSRALLRLAFGLAQMGGAVVGVTLLATALGVTALTLASALLFGGRRR
jgi:hypothetical protein